MNYFFFDTETTGLPRNYKAPVSDSANWPRMVQLAWIRCNESGEIIEEKDQIIYPENYVIPDEVSAIHGITTEIARERGEKLSDALIEMSAAVYVSDQIVCHNVEFDRAIVEAEAYRCGIKGLLLNKPTFCTKERGTNICKIPGKFGFKWPRLQELHHFLFGHHFDDAHNALNDVRATVRCFFKMKELMEVKP